MNVNARIKADKTIQNQLKVLSIVFRIKEDTGTSSEELLTMVEEIKQDGNLDEEDGELIKNAIEFNEHKAEDIITHRVDIEAVAFDEDKEKIAEVFNTSQFSRLLVYEDSIDNVLGVIHLKDFFTEKGITEKDIKDIEFGISQGIDYIAASFVRKVSDVLAIREVLEKNNATDIQIISKIENQEGVDNLDEIIAVSDGIMVARGDLGVEIPLEKLPAIQKTMIKKVHMAGRRVITATEMLESMTHNPRPTRAEVSDVANAVYDGTSCVMLSGETTVGKYPVEVVKTMAKICEDTESNIDYDRNFKNIDFTITNIPDALSHSSVNAAIDLDAKSIVVCTKSGRTALMVSRFRPIMPIVAFVTNKKAYHQLSMSWNVHPFLTEEYYSTEELSIRAIDRSKELPFIRKDDIIIIVAGIARQVNGTNLMRIEKVR